MTELAGFLVLDKPAGISSARALNAVKRRFGRNVKVGHAGTLDPFATGCLVVLVGRATKLSDQVMRLPKRYLATVKLGAMTATLDPESPEQRADDIEPPAREAIEATAAFFVGNIEQQPPAFSAIKVAGRRSYDLARSGQAIELPSRPVVVYGISVWQYEWPQVVLDVHCGKGFYVRSLARDFAERLGTLGYLTALRRTTVGPFDADRATGIEGKLLPVSMLETSM